MQSLYPYSLSVAGSPGPYGSVPLQREDGCVMSPEPSPRQLAAALGHEVHWHAVDIDEGCEIGEGPDEPVVLASVFKVAVLLELASQAAEGALDPRAPVPMSCQARCGGPTGVSVMLDDAVLSLRDTALLMMQVSDNAATDAVLARVGLERVNARMKALGLPIVLASTTEGILDQLARDIGAAGYGELEAYLGALAPQQLPEAITRARASAALDPMRTTRGTPRALTALLTLIWRDAAASAAACAETRRVLGLQYAPHRLRSGFGDEFRVSGKTGTLPFVRNEVGVVETPSARRVAVAVFLRSASPSINDADADRLIGTIGRWAVDSLAAHAPAAPTPS
jgi:beta-lactamase class A